MNDYPLRFDENKQTRLIPFIMSGDPSLDVTIELIKMMEREGVTAIELGVPFSDPQADGPVIQDAGGYALANGVSLSDVLTVGKKVRQQGCKVPLILFSYFNPLLQYGLDILAKDAREAGFSGFIVPDLPFDESESFRNTAKNVGLPVIQLVAPTSEQRIEQIVNGAEGFVYCVSSAGTTGMRTHFSEQITDFLANVKQKSQIPIAVGFGISTPEHVNFFSQHADGVIVGSALVKQIAKRREQLLEPKHNKEAMEEIATFVRSLLRKA
ncbi:tryptophan synthase, alpha chain [Seinonella peptonophila]|uniref:Tryptophan synthase alpha chain n=1 Tax=Seinonella peptonophila TaxID=112248 RepID=A0A1M4TEW9_9BACL|nr:tryptophan synthase subunit alpha [Seinonella peptonophila]SHE42991.1 tryptophan synthase, alpha chain [Seinonella peptonophila]